MSLFTGQLYPKRGLGFLTLGASLHDVLTRIKAEPQRFPDIELLYSRDNPVLEPVAVNLPGNGIRLRFDGTEQRLRLIEVLDFTKNHITFTDRDILKPGADTPGPTFRHIYHKLLGPTYAGEFIPSSESSAEGDVGVYVLSYPGVAFSFPLAASAYSPDKDVVTLMSSSPHQVATSMAVFAGASWSEACETMWTSIIPSLKSNPALPRTKDTYADEISLIRIHGAGRLQLFHRWTNTCSWIILGDTTPQDLVDELGPPNAIYRKNDKRMTIHKLRTTSDNHHQPDGPETASRPEDSTDTDQSSLMTGSEDTNGDDEVEEQVAGDMSNECFYNYFYLGFDVLVSTPVAPSQIPPPPLSPTAPPEKAFKSTSPDRVVATKVVLHGNIPGSYEFNRHRRCRWEIAYLQGDSPADTPNSETRFTDIETALNTRWDALRPASEAGQRQRGMVLNRGWGDSPGSSCEFLGGWEDNSGTMAGAVPKRGDGSSDSTTTLFGFPGLVFEVLNNGFINTVTVF